MASFDEREREVEEMLRRRVRLRRRRRWRIILAAVFGPLAVLVVSGWLYDLYWQRKVEAKLAEFRAAGQPVTWQDVLAARPLPPDEENSALVMLEAFRHLQRAEGIVRESLVYGSSRAPRSGRRQSPKAREMVAAYLADNAAALEVVASAAALPGGAYPLDPDVDPWELPFDYLYGLREAARLCGVAAACRAETGDMAGACRALMDGRTVIRSIGQPTTLIDTMVRIAVAGSWADDLQRVLEVGELSPDALRELRGQAEAEQKAFSMEPVWYGERAMGDRLFRSGAEPSSPCEYNPIPFHLYSLVPTWRERDALFYHTLMGRQVSVSSLPPRERLAESRRLEQEVWTSPLRHPLSATVMPSLSKAPEGEAGYQVGMSTVRVALAAEEWRLVHGRWPDSLDDLVPGLLEAVPEDPFSEGTLRYAKTQNGVVVYSVGPDGQDDGGLTQEEAQSRSVPGQGEPTFDERFHLLDPALRGVGESTFPEDAAAAGLSVRNLLDAGFTQDELRTLGFPEAELQQQQ